MLLKTYIVMTGLAFSSSEDTLITSSFIFNVRKSKPLTDKKNGTFYDGRK
jgi:hypothetical protein